MQKLVKDYLNELKRKQKKQKRIGIAVVLLVVMVIGAVVGSLTQAGVAMTGKAKCGIEEHQHSDGCYDEVLACGMEEGEGHQHDDSCYETESTLTCGMDESEGHQHDGSCYDENGELVCGMDESEGHQHDDSCYTSEQVLTCGQEEGSGHEHSDSCYEKQLTCGKEEHTHTEECYIDKDADVEEASKWDAQYEKTEWKETWGENLVIAAEKQIGYKESEDNYEVADDGSHKGYTRYGQFADDVYADWDAAFVNFCMHYAGKDDINIEASEMFPKETDTVKWYEKFIEMDEKNEGYLVAPQGYEPKAGDLIFFQKEDEETAFQMGIVSSYDEEKNEIKVIEGNSDNEVKENEYGIKEEEIEENHIFAYLKMTEVEEAYKASLETAKEDTAKEDGEEKSQQEEMIELTTEVDGTTITLSGPVSSFEEGKEYSIQAEKVEDEEVLATVEEAVEQMAEEQEKKVENFQPYDIKLLLDGEEVQPLGPVSVKFSGNEVAKSVEDENTEVNVLHVDENTGEATDMEATPTEEKEVVIETEHFSVYVYVEMMDIFGKATVTVEHWGLGIETVNGTASAPEKTDSVLVQADTHGEKATVKTKSEYIEIYKPDIFEIPNGSYEKLEDLSKLCKVPEDERNYTLEKVWMVKEDPTGLTKDEWRTLPSFQEYWFVPKPSGTSGIDTIVGGDIDIKIDGDCVFRFWYKPKTDENVHLTKGYFYDYDISDGKYYKSDGTDPKDTLDSTHKYLKIDEMGINGQLTQGPTNNGRLGVGHGNNSNASSWRNDTAMLYDENGVGANYYLNKGNPDGAPGIQGIVQNTLTTDGKLQFNVQAPANLFQNSEYSTEQVWDLGFKQNGDTYTLQYVNDNLNNDYTEITTRKHYPSGKGSFTVSSNDFWPMDGENNNDPLMGEEGTSGHDDRYGWLKKDASGKWVVATDINGGKPPVSDDGLDHNWFFGMQYAVEFTVGDYTGPMEYYFRGDDDFWLFIDGELAVDIGGIHSSWGHTIDLREFMNEHNMLDGDKINETHTMQVYFMERGASGSCCYMQFTLPKSRPVTIPQPDTTSYSVEKKWDDNGSEFRPTEITVNLVQSNSRTGEKTGESESVVLSAANQWKKTWNNLPIAKGGKNGTEYNYAYEVQEINTPKGYHAEVVNGVLTNYLEPVSLNVEKNWVNDGDLTGTRPEQIVLGLYTYTDGNPEPQKYEYTDDQGKQHHKTIILTSENQDSQNPDKWKGSFTDLPQYRYSWNNATGQWDAELVKYCVREMYYNGTEWKPVENSGGIAGKDGATYRVTYSNYDTSVEAWGQDWVTVPEGETSAELTITNTLLTKFRIVKKGTKSDAPRLEGAEFSLIPTDGSIATTKYIGISDNEGVIQWKKVGDEKVEETLELGRYLMKETKAPVGYTISDVEWILDVKELGRATIEKKDGTTVDRDSVISGGENGELVFEYVYYDEVLYELPSTGGSGIYWYMFSGVLLMTAASLITYRNKRREVLRS